VALDILETTCNQEVFHITRTNANSHVHCLAISSQEGISEANITKCSFHTLAPVFYGWFKPIVNKEARYKPMWFFPDDKD